MGFFSVFPPYLLVGTMLATGLVPALLSGLLVRESALILEPRFARYGARARALALGAVGVLLVGGLGLGTVGLYHTVASEGGDKLLGDIAQALLEAKLSFPEWAAGWLPESLPELKQQLAHWLGENAAQIRAASGGLLHTLALITLGLVVGAMSLFQMPPSAPGPLLSAWLARLDGLADSFSKVVFAQVKISLVNTVLTGVLLVGVLPLLGVSLPFVKTLLVLTFVFGLVPIVGNIASNVVLFLVGLTHSVAVAIGLLGYLVAIHTLEHFLNAAIIGRAVRSRAIELLPAMLLGETLFGVGGLVAAPIVYTWVKSDLKARRLV